MREKLSRCLLLYTILFFIFLQNCFSVESIRKPGKEDEDWRVLQQAQTALENSDYGNALMYAEKAKQSRKQENAWKVYILDNSFKSSKVKKAGDKIKDVLVALKKRSDNDAIGIIQAEIEKHGESFFEGSISKMQQFILGEYVYPEADCIIGKVYKLEGENELALQYLESAFNNRDALDIPEQKYDIMYMLAEIEQELNDTKKYELYLAAILKDDERYKNTSYMNAMKRTIEMNKEESVDKLFNLYRIEDDIAIPASYQLSKLYEQTGRSEEALQCTAFGAIAAFTKIYSVVSTKRPGFKYIDFQDVLAQCAKYSDIVTWGQEVNAWELFFMLAENSGSQGYLVFSRKLYMTLSLVEPEEYWRTRAANALITAQ